jgi:hypothetical protein
MDSQFPALIIKTDLTPLTDSGIEGVPQMRFRVFTLDETLDGQKTGDNNVRATYVQANDSRLHRNGRATFGP